MESKIQPYHLARLDQMWMELENNFTQLNDLLFRLDDAGLRAGIELGTVDKLILIKSGMICFLEILKKRKERQDESTNSTKDIPDDERESKEVDEDNSR